MHGTQIKKGPPKRPFFIFLNATRRYAAWAALTGTVTVGRFSSSET